MEQSVQDVEKKHSKKKKVKKQINSTFTNTASILNLYNFQHNQNKNKSQIDVFISDHSKSVKYINVKSLQILILWLFSKSNKSHNPMWISIKNFSKINYCIMINIEIEQNLFYEYLNNKSLPFIDSIFIADKKAQFKDTNLTQNLWEKIFSSENIAVKIPPPRKIVNKTNSNIQQQIYNHYLTFILNQQQLKDNLYPNDRYSIFKDYIKMVKRSQNVNIFNKILCLDCEMVTTKQGLQLAQITIINLNFEIIYQKYVKPNNQILNYNTIYSGITEQKLKDIKYTLTDVQQDLKSIIFSDTILIGHSLENDLKALQIIHTLIIDTSLLYMNQFNKKFSLKALSSMNLKSNIQQNNHDSLEDSINTLALAKLKIQILEKINKTTYVPAFDVLQQLLNAQNSILIVDKNIEYLKKYPIKIQQVKSNEGVQCKGKKLIENIIKQEKYKLNFTSFTYNQQIEENWETYYKKIDEQLSNIYQNCSKNTIFMLNFEINKEIKFQDKKNQIRPYCLFLCK